jgi:hypothetical protein
MAINEDGNEIGKIIDADSLLTLIAKQRIAKPKPVKKAAVESKPRSTQRTVETKKA